MPTQIKRLSTHANNKLMYDLTEHIPPVDEQKLILLATIIENIEFPDLATGDAIEIASPVQIELRLIAASIRRQIKDINTPALSLVA